MGTLTLNSLRGSPLLAEGISKAHYLITNQKYLNPNNVFKNLYSVHSINHKVRVMYISKGLVFLNANVVSNIYIVCILSIIYSIHYMYFQINDVTVDVFCL